MPLMKPMILVLTIALSNGGEVTYEMSRNYYSQRVQFVDNDNISHDMLTIHAFDSAFIYEFIKVEDEIQHFKREVLQPILNWSGEEEFQHSLTPYFIDDFQGLEHIRLTPPGLKTGHFYIYIKELDQLYPDGKIRMAAPIINEGYILAFSDVARIENDFLSKPIGVNIEWKNLFSSFILKMIEVMNNNQN